MLSRDIKLESPPVLRHIKSNIGNRLCESLAELKPVGRMEEREEGRAVHRPNAMLGLCNPKPLTYQTLPITPMRNIPR